MKFNKEQDYWASVFSTDTFLCIDTYSGLGMTGRDSVFPSIILTPDADGISVGESILKALSDSRSLTNRDERAIFFDLEANKEKYNSWVTMLMERFGYKSKRSLFENMKKCGIHCVNGVITISPTRHEKLEGWGRTKGDGIEDVVLPVDSDPAEIGAGLRLALSRCKG